MMIESTHTRATYFKPVSYPIVADGPAGKFFRAVNRHISRSSHIHFRIRDPCEKSNELITTLYNRDDPYEKQSSCRCFDSRRSISGQEIYC